MAEANIINEPGKRELIVTRSFNAPVSLVWEAWTTPEHLMNWFGPNGFTHTFHEINIKPGGVWRFTMHGPDGTDYPNRIMFTEVIKHEKLSYAHDADKPNDPDLFEVDVIFEKQGSQTKLTTTMRFASAEIRDKVEQQYNAIEGAKQHLGRLAEFLTTMDGHFIDSTDQEIENSRILKAPCELVYKAWTEPELLSQWWGPKGFTNTFKEFNPVDGGKWTFTMHGPDGKDYPNESVFIELVKPHLIKFLHVSGHTFEVTATFERHGTNETLLTFRMLFTEQEEFEKIKTFVKEKNEENIDKLEQLLSQLQ